MASNWTPEGWAAHEGRHLPSYPDQAALSAVTDKLTTFETNETNRVKASAKAAVQPHITRGAIAPEDTASITFWENAWVANASTTEAQLAKLQLPGDKALASAEEE